MIYITATQDQDNKSYKMTSWQPNVMTTDGAAMITNMTTNATRRYHSNHGTDVVSTHATTDGISI